ncbi:hypothetical protein BVRB_003490 [Beta vulgaris subsp. vulgaris]|uniref:Uncharacterized protein n=1 Tax=Beta vulgaris subsp. vulgaris TaxID=3555 RepID=A0A0J8B820_BETVV|nr:hypothetical protein BVRB_003490 [Beta vulgaris subsp. vulgaris]
MEGNQIISFFLFHTNISRNQSQIIMQPILGFFH